MSPLVTLALLFLLVATWTTGGDCWAPRQATLHHRIRPVGSALQLTYRSSTGSRTDTVAIAASTIEAPTRERVKRSSTTPNKDNNRDDGQEQQDKRKDGPLEYLQDPNESREMDDPFHILLLGETFVDRPKITLNYVSGNLQYILEMPFDDALDASMVAQDFGMACLGTWSREECLTYGRALRQRDLVVRVVPFAAGGNRSWQSKQGAGSSSNNNAASSGSN
jgi:hypothetical protein